MSDSQCLEITINFQGFLVWIWIWVFFSIKWILQIWRIKTIQTNRKQINHKTSITSTHLLQTRRLCMNKTSHRQTDTNQVFHPLSIFITYPIFVTRLPSSPQVTIPPPSLTYHQRHLIIPSILIFSFLLPELSHTFTSLSIFHTHFSTMPFCYLCLPTQLQTSSPFLSPWRTKSPSLLHFSTMPFCYQDISSHFFPFFFPPLGDKL